MNRDLDLVLTREPSHGSGLNVGGMGIGELKDAVHMRLSCDRGGAK